MITTVTNLVPRGWSLYTGLTVFVFVIENEMMLAFATFLFPV
jgi:hypothetical protein